MRHWLSRLEHGRGEHVEGATPGLPGVDVSNYQGAPGDWRTEATPLEWAGVKMTELGTDGSRYVNPYAAADWAWLKAAGKGRIGYLFGHPSMSASATAALFAGAIRSLGVDDGDAIAVDMEVTDGLRAAPVADWTATVLGLLQREFSRLPLVYTFLSFAEAGNCAGLGRYPLWIADISRPAGHPRIPAPWNTFAIHQYSWDPLDRDTAAYPSLAAMRGALGKKETTVAYICNGKLSLHQIADAEHTAASTILRLTAIHDGRFPDDVAGYVNDVFAGKKPPAAPVPEHAVLRIPAS